MAKFGAGFEAKSRSAPCSSSKARSRSMAPSSPSPTISRCRFRRQSPSIPRIQPDAGSTPPHPGAGEALRRFLMTPLASTDDAGGDKKLALMADQEEKRENRRKKAMSRNIPRSRSVDNGGYLLKTSVFPISFGMRRSRRKKSLISTGSLKAGATSVAAMAAKITEKEWWRTKPNESDINGGLSSSYSGISSGSSSRSSSTSSSRSTEKDGWTF